MSKAEELLNGLSESDISLQSANPETEPHIVIGDDRFISVPVELQRIAVQYDHDVETVTFDCPRYWDDLDMSELSIYINYMRKDREVGVYKATDISVDAANDRIMHFNWKISRNVTEVVGSLKFLICIKKGDADGNEVNHWNSELNTEMYISEGLEVEPSIFDPYPDIISQWEDEVQRVKDILLAARDSGEFDGATFTPAVDDDGNLSWTNDKGKDNPATKNIKGYSPKIVVREVDGGKEFVVTDYSGSQTVKISDGYSPKIIVRDVDGGKELIITDYSGSQTVTVMDGTDGTSGTDGVSPTVTVDKITGGHRVTITDKDGTKTFDVKDGVNTTETGSDGVSPTVAIVDITGGHRVTITDVDGAKTFDVMDGATGPAGENGYSPKIVVREVDGGKELIITDYSGSHTVSIMDGTDGATGAKGADGVSPTVTVTDISGGHRVTITDKDGAKSFDVMDGEGGSGGTTMYIGEVEPSSGPTLWFDTSTTSVG